MLIIWSRLFFWAQSIKNSTKNSTRKSEILFYYLYNSLSLTWLVCRFRDIVMYAFNECAFIFFLLLSFYFSIQHFFLSCCCKFYTTIWRTWYCFDVFREHPTKATHHHRYDDEISRQRRRSRCNFSKPYNGTWVELLRVVRIWNFHPLSSTCFA